MIEETCDVCGALVVGAVSGPRRLVHLDDGTHVWRDSRPSHRDVSIWSDVRAALQHIRTVEFYLGLRPEKPAGGIDWEIVQLQLADARVVLGQLANALADGAKR